MKYVTMMIELDRTETDPRNTIYAVVTVEEYRRSLELFLLHRDCPHIINAAKVEAFGWVPSKAIAIHCGPERDAP